MNKAIQKLLSSNKIEDISNGLNKFETKGSIKELTLVLEILNSENTDTFENQIIEIISNIKDKEAATIIIDAILNIKSPSVKLYSYMQICWQSALDFSQYLDLFLKIFLENDYRTSLESFTVIENILEEYSYSDEHRKALLDTLNNKIKKMDDDKLILAKELILILNH